MRLTPMAAVLAALCAPGSASATWSIVAVDPETREVGIAVASCIGGVEITAGIVPGKGVVTAQAMTHVEGRDEAMSLLDSGASPRAVLRRVASEDFDPGSLFSWFSGLETRQYGVAVLGFEAEAASFTGRRTIPWSGSLLGHGVAVQGNMLWGPEVVQAALASFETDGQDCRRPLSDRLVAALAAGAAAGGDRRCEKPLAALSAYLEVAEPDDPPGASTLRLLVPYEGGVDTSVLTFFRQMFFPERGSPEQNPVRKLRSQYEAWRRAHLTAPSLCEQAGSEQAGTELPFSFSGGS